MGFNLLRTIPDSRLARLGVSIVPALLAHLLTLVAWPLVRPLASPLFLAAIALSARLGGFAAGLVSTLLSGLLVNYFFIIPYHEPGGGREAAARLALFFMAGLLICRAVDSRGREAETAGALSGRLMDLSLREHHLVEAERGRLAREVHDELGQSLTGLKMELHRVGNRLPEADGGGTAGGIREELRGLTAQVDSAISSVRRIATELRPPVLDDLGLPAAIEWQAQEFRRVSGIACRFTTNVESLDLPDDYATAVFRVSQEALTNVARHAGATAVEVSLLRLGEGLLLRVEDDGKGIRPAEDGRGDSLGLFGMRERARLIGGALEITGGPEGTVVQLKAPLAPDESGA